MTALPTSKAELDNLRSIVARSLQDVTAPGLSADARFVMAYDAARTLSLLVVRAAGYRPRAVGGHYNTFLALEAADPAFAELSAYFDGCRMKRNQCEYDFAGGVTDTERAARTLPVHLVENENRLLVAKGVPFWGDGCGDAAGGDFGTRNRRR